ncbi:hypothetical protein EMIHUDRAFT_432170 [Emiliania huxleyi CCMP1516]|uniref:Uncharacterized protein n=2 Tax=Emiliania huxleyi TaxID=2903 RepID=A0A0D3JHW6_EMIH1|nr:hypothetical protein EMIHUDRAFT_432170 [Emiliania huxleyi CCMP1516]EOD23101.1 hypothetical protein EMIHUDRAFT_432170 [Emiliania huxleyi CCMP1516]|mmetsp:Transcript_27600/g.91842  ORF Transcript_27600/g.91842 Transcript_27600/m.91842 type:complete len:236 (-) Transcript_27600:172-879(-)|eukprot:XP_005775530.1 hypothetical protein EMIHUDRAFT_432170 [Emiliania huxleyi CCMP1516]
MGRGEPSEKQQDRAAIRRAKERFRATARQQRKLLVAGGVEAPRASLQLLDQLVQHRHGSAPSCSSDATVTELEHIVAATGFNSAQATRTLLLKQEISHLRSQGHTTADVISKLDHRLRAGSGLRRRSSELENHLWGGGGAERHAGLGERQHAALGFGPAHKKLKLGDDRLGAAVGGKGKAPWLPPPDSRLWPPPARDVSEKGKRPWEEEPPPPVRAVRLRLSEMAGGEGGRFRGP